MKEEFGKWLMDISKYMVTAILLTTAFGDMDTWWLVSLVIIISVLTLCIGLWLLRDKKQRNNGSSRSMH